MVLTHQAILEGCNFEDEEAREAEGGLISPCVRENVRSASYDLRLGADYFLREDKDGNALTVRRLENGRTQSVSIPPDGVIVVCTEEKLELPPNIVGHLSLKLDLLLEGLIFANQSQIDAGFKGPIFVLLYNLSNSPVTISRRQSIVRLELVELEENSERPYDGDYQRKTLAEVMNTPLTSSMHVLNQRVEKRLSRLRFYEAATFVVPLIITLGLVLATMNIGGLKERQSNLEKELGKQDQTLTSVHAQWEKFRSAPGSESFSHWSRIVEEQREAIRLLKAEVEALKTAKSNQQAPDKDK